MGDPQPHPDPGEDRRTQTDRGAMGGSRGRIPVGVFALALGIALLVLMVVLHLTGTIGPGSH